jgi:hypothetical protein
MLKGLKRHIAVAFGIAFAMLIVPIAAMAQTAPAVSTGGVIDFAPIMRDVVVPTLSAVLLVGATWAVTWLAKKLKLSADSEVRTYLDAALGKAVAFGVGKVSDLSEGNWTQVKVKNEAVAVAANYALTKVPDALRYLKVDPDHLREMIEARVHEYLADGPAAVIAPLPAVAAASTGAPAGA